ncbi:NUDIX domain-containing protein [Candidatus Micrarchaeota archaeon]|nr:NUDIX domain-containing protein [Candidatus Micrarchaeota archaeon]
MNLLLKYKLPKNVVAHSKKVAKIAVEVACELKRNGFGVDLELVERGALLHDIGRSVTHGLDHGYFGGKILRKEDGGGEVARIAERHVLGGISKEEAELMGLPAKDFIPKTIEEKIVCYADKLSDRNKIERIEKKLGRNAAFDRMIKLIQEVDSMRGRVQELNVYAVVRDSKGRILVMKRREPKIWEFPGGGVEWGESPEKAVRREVKEETDLKIKRMKLLCTSSKVYKKGRITKHSVYIAFEGRGEGKVKFGVEHSIAMWADLKRIRKLKLGLNVEPIVGFLNVDR